ncbi:hypothetical protein JXI42_14570 [bacterium]|nr:hypothetical protein [bacterium]
MNKVLIFTSLFLIVLTLPDSSMAFKPSPPPSLPVIWVDTLTCKEDLKFTYLYTEVELDDSFAYVTIEMDLEEIACDSLTLYFYIKIPSLEILVNKKEFNYSNDNRSIKLSGEDLNSINILTEYAIPSRHVFQGPPSPWVRGSIFEVYSPLLRYSQYGEKIIPDSASVEIIVDDDFTFEGEQKLWNIKEEYRQLHYRLMTPVGLKITSKWTKMD